MTFSGDEIYEASVETVIAMFVDPDTVRARYEAAGDRDIEVVECGPDRDGFVIRTTRTVDVDLPGFARRVLKPTNSMVQVDRWGPIGPDGARDGDFAIEVKGAPVKVGGTMRLEPTGDGSCRHTVEGKVEVKVPLIGGKIAGWAEAPSQQRANDEFAFNRARLR
ncbi:MAG: DUF2505 domain-containing protein [Acidimicrobiia bacterium]